MTRSIINVAAFRDALRRAQSSSKGDPVSFLVVRVGDAWEAHVTAEKVSTHASRADALAAIADSPAFRESVSRKLPDSTAFRGLAEYRWVDAATVEDLPSSIDGSQVRANMISEMARNVGLSETAILVDGGNVSEVHESVWNSAAKAAGWAFGACEVRDSDERPHLFLLARLKQEVDVSVNKGELLYGSIAFIGESRDRYGDGDAIGAQLISYALTNTPFIGSLEPHAPRERSHNSQADVPLHFTRTHQIMTIRNTAAPVVAEEKLPAREMLGEAMSALPEQPESDMIELEPEGDFVGADAAEMFALDMVAKLRILFDSPDASPAELADKLDAASEGFAATLEDVAFDENAGPSGDELGEVAMERAERIGLRAQLKSLSEQVKMLTVERAQHAAEKRRQHMAEHISARYTSAKIEAPSGDDMAELLDLCRSVGSRWETLVERTLRASNPPPRGQVIGSTRSANREPTDLKDALAICEDSLRRDSANAGLTNKQFRSLRYAKAKTQYPTFFGDSATSSDE